MGGLKYLDAQLSTGGIIFPDKVFRYTLKQAHTKGWIPHHVAAKCKGNYFQDVNDQNKRVNYRTLALQSMKMENGERYVVTNNSRFNDSGELSGSMLSGSDSATTDLRSSFNNSCSASGTHLAGSMGFAASTDTFSRSQSGFVSATAAQQQHGTSFDTRRQRRNVN